MQRLSDIAYPDALDVIGSEASVSSLWLYRQRLMYVLPTSNPEDSRVSTEFGPYIQMRKLAQQMAIQYQKDTGLALIPLLAHFMDEVEVNVASDRFDHTGFMEKIRAPLTLDAEVTLDDRRKEFLNAVASALEERIQRETGAPTSSL